MVYAFAASSAVDSIRAYIRWRLSLPSTPDVFPMRIYFFLSSLYFVLPLNEYNNRMQLPHSSPIMIRPIVL